MNAAAEYLAAHAAEYHHCVALRALIRVDHCRGLLARPPFETTDSDWYPKIFRPPACLVCPMGGSFALDEAGGQKRTNSTTKTAPVTGGTGDRVPDLRGPIPSRGSGAGDGGRLRDSPSPPTLRPKKGPPLTEQPFSVRLRLARKNAGMGQRDLGEVLGLPQSHISAAEVGRQLNRTYTNKLRAWVARQEGR